MPLQIFIIYKLQLEKASWPNKILVAKKDWLPSLASQFLAEPLLRAGTKKLLLEKHHHPKHVGIGPVDCTIRAPCISQASSGSDGRLMERWTTIWGEEDIPCISLSMLSASVMHKLRPQPAWDRTCTAAAAAGLLLELDMRSELSACELVKQAEAVECSLDVLLDALTARRLRLGRSITRKQRHNRNCI